MTDLHVVRDPDTGLTPRQESLFDRGYCPVCVIYDLRGRKKKGEAWRWCRCCGQAWRRLPLGELIATQLTTLLEPCKHQRKGESA